MTVKQEETYLTENYPDEISAREEIGRYIESYNQSRPPQALHNFPPAHLHELNNKSALLQELNNMQRKTRAKRKAYWAEQSKIGQQPIEGGKGESEIVDPGATREEVFNDQQPDIQTTSDADPKS